MGKYLRLRLNIDISKPLCRGRVVRMAGNEKGWVDFRYERLPIFCFWCGKLDHDDRDYPLWIESKESLVIEERQFGPWLRAELGRLQRPQVAEANRKNKGEGKSKEETHQSNTRDSRHNWRSARMAYDNIVFPLTPKEATKVSDLDMADVTPQGKKLVNFEEQLREIDSAINDDVTIQELTGFKELKKDKRFGSGYSNIVQLEVLGAGVKDKAIRAQMLSPISNIDSTGLHERAKDLCEA